MKSKKASKQQVFTYLFCACQVYPHSSNKFNNICFKLTMKWMKTYKYAVECRKSLKKHLKTINSENEFLWKTFKSDETNRRHFYFLFSRHSNRSWFVVAICYQNRWFQFTNLKLNLSFHIYRAKPNDWKIKEKFNSLWNMIHLT